METSQSARLRATSGQTLTRRAFIAASAVAGFSPRLGAAEVTLGVQRKWRETVPLDHFHRVRDQFAAARVSLSAYNISITDTFSDAEVERAFAMTKALGAPLITSSSNVKTVARIAAAAVRHRMLVGVHNHSRIDANEFATAKSLTDALQQGQWTRWRNAWPIAGRR